MSAPRFDYAIIGSTPLSRLLAGLLAGTHGKKVIHFGESVSFYRLPRGIDLSSSVITRPESWSILRAGVDETMKLIKRIGGRGTWSYANPIFFAKGARAGEALSHMAHMARAFGTAAEPVAPSHIGATRTGFTIRDAIRLHRAPLEPALDAWLESQGVVHGTPQKLIVHTDGSVSFTHADENLEARQTILADDTAILAHLPFQQWPRLLQRQQTSTILTTPTKPLGSPIMAEIQSGALLLQQSEGGIAAIGPSDLATFSLHMQALLGQDRQVEQAGQTSFQTLITMDGAPACGRAASVGADIIAGFGSIGPFLAPALARWIAGTPTDTEEKWFGARLVTRDPSHHAVAEYAPDLGSAA